MRLKKIKPFKISMVQSGSAEKSESIKPSLGKRAEAIVGAATLLEGSHFLN
jgi:hypothetical protein